MFRKQLIGFAGAMAALITLALVWEYRQAFSGYGPIADDAQTRLDYALTWLLLPGIALLIGIVGAARRGFYRDAIDGTRTPANPSLEINLRYNQNTVEQLLLAAIAWAGLVLKLPHDKLFVIPVMAVLFLAGRITFLAGYLVYPIARAYGMVLTIVPTLMAYVWLTEHLLKGQS
ncbi:MAG TPA: MAPEG family protein [Rhizomicrobium sp.]|jgi:hypothetical protein